MKINELIKEAEQFIKVMNAVKNAIGPLTFKMTQAKLCEEYTKKLMKRCSVDEVLTILFIIDAYQDN